MRQIAIGVLAAVLVVGLAYWYTQNDPVDHGAADHVPEQAATAHFASTLLWDACEGHLVLWDPRTRSVRWLDEAGTLAAELALPWGVLQPGTQMRGFLYFEPIEATANAAVLTWHVIDPEHTRVVDLRFEAEVRSRRRIGWPGNGERHLQPRRPALHAAAG